MKLNTFSSYRKKTKRKGRGISAGQGKTAGRGTKGQKARTGKKLRPGFEGGQTPFFQKIPKLKGFRNPNRVPFQVVNIGSLGELGTDVITHEVLFAAHMIPQKDWPVKVLGDGELTRGLTIELEAASAGALEKIQKAGGTFRSTALVAREKKKKHD